MLRLKTGMISSIRLLMILFFLSGFSSATAQEIPNRADIAKYLESLDNGLIKLMKIDFKVFPDATGGTGRVAIAGAYVLNRSLYSETQNFSVAKRELISRGVPQSKVSIVLNSGIKRLQRENFWLSKEYQERSADEIGTISFNSELIYKELIASFEFTGSPKSPELTGLSRKDQLGPAIVVAGSSVHSHLINVSMSIYEEELLANKQLENSFADEFDFARSVFRNGEIYASKSGRTFYHLECGDNPDWLLVAESNRYQTMETLCLMTVDVDGISHANVRFKKGDQERVRVLIGAGISSSSGDMVSSLQIFVSQNGKWTNTGRHFVRKANGYGGRSEHELFFSAIESNAELNGQDGQKKMQSSGAVKDLETSSYETVEVLLGLKPSEKMEIQRRLYLVGFDPNGIDGVFGRGTRGAISAWQLANELNQTGYFNEAQLLILEKSSEDKYDAWQRTKATQVKSVSRKSLQKEKLHELDLVNLSNGRFWKNGKWCTRYSNGYEACLKPRFKTGCNTYPNLCN